VRPSSSAGLRVSITHDWLNQTGGAEYVLSVLHEMFPSAPIHTAILDRGRIDLPGVSKWNIRSTWLDRLPAIHAHHQPYLPLYPMVWRTTHIDDPATDIVLSNSSAFCHGVDAGATAHACYCLTPPRFVWQPKEYLEGEGINAPTRFLFAAALPLLRAADRAAAARVTRFAAISSAVRARIARHYARDSTVIHPPADLQPFKSAALERDLAPRGAHTDRPYHLVVARLVPYKRIDTAIRAFEGMGRRLIVAGDGRDRSRLQGIAGPNTEFVGRVPLKELAALIAGCQGLVWPGEEDYGLAPIEAMAAGRPVIAQRAGGVLDTVIDGRTGVLFDGPDHRNLAAAISAADRIAWQPSVIASHAARFNRQRFETSLTHFLQTTIDLHARQSAPDAPTRMKRVRAAHPPGDIA